MSYTLDPYTLLFDEAEGGGPGLPDGIRAIYGGDWRMPPAPAGRPFTYTNFVVSHDGRITFDEPGRAGGADISLRAPHDTWLMALLRARADAILVGGGTLRGARRHRWTPWETFPAAEAELIALRAAEGRAPLPLFVVLSGSGDFPGDVAALRVPGQPSLVATSAAGEAKARAAIAGLDHVELFVSPGEDVDLAALMATLRDGHGIGTLLSEGGGRVYGELIGRHLIDEVFTTMSPVIVGNRLPPQQPRPSLVEGVAFPPDAPPRLRLISLRRHGDFLFQRASFH
jgi:riboflavin biosynthesis pyrimidine reductase